MRADILIKNGRVVDTYRNIDEIRDIAIKDRKIVNAEEVTDANQIFDAANCIVTSGLIDFHTHVFVFSSEIAVSPESQCFPTGVTTVVDAGSAGVANYLSFYAATKFSKVRQFSYLHASSCGILSLASHEDHDPAHFETEKILAVLKENPKILGLKVRQSRNVVGDFGVRPLEAAMKISRQADKHTVCHVTDAPIPSNEIVKYFQKDDVYAHVYHGKGYTILGDDGHVMPELFEAKQRGVIFDAAVGKSHFSFDVAKAALEDGFLPDIISTDITVNNAWIDGMAFSLPSVMSRFLAIGMDIPQIVKCTTQNPARLLGMECELGSLSEGTCADIAIHRVVPHSIMFSDPCGQSLIGNKVFDTQMTISDGAVVYRSIQF